MNNLHNKGNPTLSFKLYQVEQHQPLALPFSTKSKLGWAWAPSTIISQCPENQFQTEFEKQELSKILKTCLHIPRLVVSNNIFNIQQEFKLPCLLNPGMEAFSMWFSALLWWSALSAYSMAELAALLSCAGGTAVVRDISVLTANQLGLFWVKRNSTVFQTSFRASHCVGKLYWSHLSC